MTSPVWDDNPIESLNSAEQDARAVADRNRRAETDRQRDEQRQAARRIREHERGGRVETVETQVLVDGQPVTVSETVRQQPGETVQAARGRAADEAVQEAPQTRAHWDDHDQPDQQRPRPQHGV